MVNTSIPVCDDTLFGPFVQSRACRGGFDFTVMFEETIMSILPSVAFIFIALLRVACIFRKRSLKVKLSYLYSAKLVAILIYSGFQLALIVLSSTRPTPTSPVSVAASTFCLCSSMSMAIMSPLEHRNSPRPSFIITSYLLASLVFDIARVRTAWLLGNVDAVASTMTAAIIAKLLVLALEMVNKRTILIEKYSDLSYEATSGIFSRGLFWWLASLLRDGSSRILGLPDLFSIHEKLDSDKLVEDLSKTWTKCDATRRHKLATATCWTWRYEILKIVFPRLAIVALSLIQPFITQKIVENILDPVNQETQNNGFGLIGAVAFVYLGITILTGFYQHLSFRLMTMVRGGLIGLIYHKVATLPISSMDSDGFNVVTLVGTDVERICETWYLLISDFGPSVIQLGFSVWLLERQLGLVCIAPVVLALLSMAVSFWAASYVTARQKIWLEAVQSRVAFTTHVLGSMKCARMLGLGGKLQQIIQALRLKELDLSKKYRRLASFNVCLVNLPDNFCQLITFMAFAIIMNMQGKGSFTLPQAISSLSILTVLMSPLGLLLWAVPQIYSALGCFERIQIFLACDPWADNRKLLPNTKIDELLPYSEKISPPSEGPIGTSSLGDNTDRIVVQNATFGWNDSVPVARNISLRVKGETGLTLILGPVGCGKSTLLKGLLGETKILGGCVWTSSKGISFCDQTPWIPIGTVRDCIIGRYVFSQDWYDTVVCACALDIDLALLQDGGNTNVGSQGACLSGGQKQRVAIARALYSQKPIAIFDDVLSGLDATTQQIVMERVFGPKGLLRELGITTILATHSMKCLDVADQIVVLDAHGYVTKQGSPDTFLDIQANLSKDKSQSIFHLHDGHRLATRATPQAQEAEEPAHQDRQVGDATTFKYYFSSLGWLSFSIFALFVVSEGAFGTMQTVWLTLWSESPHSFNTGYWLGLYALFGALRAICLVISVYYLYVLMVPKSAQKLHAAVLGATFRAPMNFISKTGTGVLINRFSQDMQIVDMVLPGALVNTSFTTASCLASVTLSIVATPYFAAVIPMIIAMLYFLQRFYLRTSRQLRLLELESKAPLLSHIIETIDGKVSIRAFGWVGSFTKKAHNILNSCQKPFYLLLCVQRWLAVVLGCIVAILATLLTALAVVLPRSRVSAGFTGIALVNMMSLSQSLANLIVFWTSLETSLGAVSRVKSFSEDTPQEVNPEGQPLICWPAQGSLTFDDWTAGYSDFTVLHNISVSILPGQKIAICGRTGSGKSSLITSVLGLVDGSGGKIILDGVDLSTISKDIIRAKINCITQDPFLFGGTIRLNLDPLGEASDTDIKAALERVGLWTMVQRVAETKPLVSEHPLGIETEELHLSHGQSQLFCLARALLRHSPIVLLDEPTSSVDVITEKQIQELVQTEFQDSTVIMVTHRLSEICKFDKVAVLDRGVLVEFGSPGESVALAKLYDAQEK